MLRFYLSELKILLSMTVQTFDMSKCLLICSDFNVRVAIHSFKGAEGGSFKSLPWTISVVSGVRS